MQVLVVENDAEIRQAIAEHLRGAGHSVDVAANLAGGDFLLSKTTYDVVVLAQSLPDGDAMAFLRQQADRRWSIPILVLITSGLDRDRTAALQYAGDYLDVPFRPAALLAKLDPLTRRRPTREAPMVRIGDLEIDRVHLEVHRGGRLVTLTRPEFAVLELLADRAGQFVPRAELAEHVRDRASLSPDDVDMIIHVLRRKLGRPEVVHRMWGDGYRLLVRDARPADQDSDAPAIDQESSAEPETGASSSNGGGVLVAQATYSVAIYLGDEAGHEQVQAAVEQLVRTAGWEITDRDDPVLGSWFRRLSASARAAASSDLARDAAATAAHAAESRLVLAQDATVTATMMQNLGPVLGALQPTKDAVIRVGALLIVKVDWIVAVHQLTAAQQLKLDHQPQLLTSPHDILASLHLPAAASPHHEPEPSPQPNHPTGPT